MVFTDQMLQPKRVLPVPKHLEPPRVDLSSGKGQENDLSASADPFPSSLLGVWYLDGCDVFLKTAETVLSYSSGSDDADHYERIGHLVKTNSLPGNFMEARGRSNLNIKAVPPELAGGDSSPSDASSVERRIVQRLQEQAADVAKQVSRRMEVWLDLPSGSMQQAHAKGKSSSMRLLDYPAGVAVPPHTDGSAYTIVYNDAPMMIQSPVDDDLWYELPMEEKKNNSYQLLLMLGSHLDQAIPARLQQIGSEDAAISTILRAPVHRLEASPSPRRALTLHIKADTVWPSTLEELNKSNHKQESEGILTATDYHDRDISWDAELFSQYLCAKYVPSVEDVQAHLELLGAIVNGRHASLAARDRDSDEDTCSISSSGDDLSFSSLSSSSSSSSLVDETPTIETSPSYRLPSVHCTGYWQLQAERYCTFLRIHQKRPQEAAGMLPPRAIHHVWLCHQLHPLRYKADCKKLLGGSILGHDNSKYCLEGCPKFHSLWEAETGARWPSPSDLRHEAETAENIAESTYTELTTCMISANLWHNYDGLTRLHDELQTEAPHLFDSDPKAALSLLEDARLDYARFLIAASYASTVGTMVTPSGPVDLVWHTHQTHPKAYHDAIEREFPKAPVDHVPCGALNPPPNEGKEWLEMTDKIWIKLYGHGVNVQGRAIHCCSTDENPRPTRLLVSSDNNIVFWWFPERYEWWDYRPPIEQFTNGFPLTREEVSSMTRVLSGSIELNVDDLLDKVFTPLSVAMQNAVRAHREEIDRRKVPRTYKALGYLWYLTYCVMVGCSTAAGVRWPKDGSGVLVGAAVVGALCWAGSFLQRQRIRSLCWSLWSQIEALVDSFNSQALECGIQMEFRFKQSAAKDPSKPSLPPYQGEAILFRRCQPSSNEEMPSVPVEGEDEE